MFCRKCGKEIPDDSEFCPKCGTAVGKEISDQVNAQEETVVADTANTTPNETTAVNEMSSDTVIAAPSAIIEDKPDSRKKKAVIPFVVIAIVVVVFAAIFIPVKINIDAKNKEAHHEFEYHLLSDDTYTIDRYLGTDPNVIIPATINKKPVTVIAEKAFYESSIESVEFGENVCKIENSAFELCKNLSEVNFRSSNESKREKLVIGDLAFNYCSSVKNVVLPSVNTTIGMMAFHNCESLLYIDLNNVQEYGMGAFGETGLKEVYISEFGRYGDTGALAVFGDCKNLERVYINADETVIPIEAFVRCTALKEVVWKVDVSNKTAYIRSRAFSGCTELETIIGMGDKEMKSPTEVDKNYGKDHSDYSNGFSVKDDAFLGCEKFKNPESSGIPSMSVKKGLKDYMGEELAEMSYKEFTDNFGMPTDGYFWGRAQYPDVEVGFDLKGGSSGSSDGFNPNSRNKLKYIIIYGGTETKINDELHLGEGLDYYNARLSFDVYDALKMGAGDHGAVWYEVNIIYSERSTGKQLYSVDLRLTEGDYTCYAAKITSLQ